MFLFPGHSGGFHFKKMYIYFSHEHECNSSLNCTFFRILVSYCAYIMTSLLNDKSYVHVKDIHILDEDHIIMILTRLFRISNNNNNVNNSIISSSIFSRQIAVNVNMPLIIMNMPNESIT